jgi:hypothetical protein
LRDQSRHADVDAGNHDSRKYDSDAKWSHAV